MKKFRKNKTFQKGGKVDTSFPQPDVNATTASGALDGVENQQKQNAETLAKENAEQAGGRRRRYQRGGADDDVIVPQFNQTGSEGNSTISGTVDSTLTGREQGKYDADVDKPAPDSGMPKKGGGRKRRRRKRKTRRKRKRGGRKTRRKTRKRKSRKRKRKTRRRR